jgi:hypothetical protein
MPSWLKWTLIVSVVVIVVASHPVAFKAFASTEIGGIVTLVKSLTG